MITNIHTINISQIKSTILSSAQGDCFIIIDKYIANAHDDLLAELESFPLYMHDAGEKYKTVDHYSRICDFLLHHDIKRTSHLFVIGGGSIIDMAGFVAATVLRGISWSIIPTTMLAMVDSAVGGKVGLNSEYGKNLIGAFYHPTNIYLVADFLNTLSETQIMSGKGEILKYCFLNKEIKELVTQKKDINLIIHACMHFKQEIVKQDFKDNGIRKTLNLGHTLGHAYEVCTGVAHGLAVVWGIEKIIKLFNQSMLKEFNQLVETLEIETPYYAYDKEEFIGYLKRDKKRSGEEIEIIIPFENSYKIQKMKFSELESIINERLA
jgi:3-dehydroquinate synthetase